jgi:hypothetical protein
MEIYKGIGCFIEYDITGNINATQRYVKALKAFVHVTITKENTSHGAVLTFLSVIGAEVGPAGTSEDS